MKVVLARVDERLVHGQIITSWAKQLAVKKILVIDDAIAKDEFMSTVLTLSAPSGVSIEILSVEKAMEKLNIDRDNNIHTMLLFKKVEYALALCKQGFPLKELNIGNIGAGPRRKAISRNVSVTPEEIDCIKKVVEEDVFVYLQMLYTDSRINVLEVI